MLVCTCAYTMYHVPLEFVLLCLYVFGHSLYILTHFFMYVVGIYGKSLVFPFLSHQGHVIPYLEPSVKKKIKAQ